MKKFLWNLLVMVVFGGMLFVFVNDVCMAIEGVGIPFDADDVSLKNFGEDAGSGVGQIESALMEIVTWFRNILGFMAVAWITWQGYRMMITQGSEDEFTNAKQSIMWGVVALVASFIVEPLIRNVIYGGGDQLAPGQAILDVETSTARGIAEIGGLMKWVRTIVGVVAVGFILFTGIQAMLAADDDAEIENQKRNIKWIVIGILIIIMNDILINYGIYGSPEIGEDGKVKTVRNSWEIITELSGVMAYVLGFFAAIAVAAIIYGGFLMVTAAFDEEQAQKGKTIILDVGIGVLIVLISYSLVRAVIFL